jgi:hypothetical protein
LADLVENHMIIFNAYHVTYSRLAKQFSSRLRMTTGYKDKL